MGPWVVYSIGYIRGIQGVLFSGPISRGNVTTLLREPRGKNGEVVEVQYSLRVAECASVASDLFRCPEASVDVAP